MNTQLFENPFRPGAGHQPPYLAGRTTETSEICKYLGQNTVTQNVILTGLRGVGKTVLLESIKPIAQKLGWLWTNSDMSETASISEANMVTRILTDISLITSGFTISEHIESTTGFINQKTTVKNTLNSSVLESIYNKTPGLSSDKLKKVIEMVWNIIKTINGVKGIVFAYDEAQNLCDHAEKDQYPLSILLEVFQSLQRKNIPVLLIMTGLPTLFPKLVDTRTYAERMFHVIFLKHLDKSSAKEAILKPIESSNSPIKFTNEAVDTIIDISGCYPYFIQYICKEVYDIWVTKIKLNEIPSVPVEDILYKLDIDFFQGRWMKATDRQRELLTVISTLDNCDDEFSVQDIVVHSKQAKTKAFSSSAANQMLSALSNAGLVFKNRFGKYSLAVPLLAQFIKRQNNLHAASR